MINAFVKFNVVDTKIPNTSGLPTKHTLIQTSSVLRRRLKIFKRISNTRRLVKKTYYNTKVTEIENKNLGVTSLVTTAMLNTKATET